MRGICGGNLEVECPVQCGFFGENVKETKKGGIPGTESLRGCKGKSEGSSILKVNIF